MVGVTPFVIRDCVFGMPDEEEAEEDEEEEWRAGINNGNVVPDSSRGPVVVLARSVRSDLAP